MATRARTPRLWRWTRAHLARLPDDGNRYEVLDGALLVTPQARLAHQVIAAELLVLLRQYCVRYRVGVVVGPGAVVWDDNELQPDVQVIPISVDEARAAEWESIPTPLLVVEILSTGSERHDRGVKRAAYLTRGIAEYWIVDIEGRTVSVFRPGTNEPAVATGSLRWQPAPAQPPLEINLLRVFGGS